MSGPVFKFGDMFQDCWNKPGSLFVVTGNSTVKGDGSLVMGRGAALELKRRLSGIDRLLGEQIRLHGSGSYGLIVLSPENIKGRLGHWSRAFCGVGLFQVKEHFRDRADPKLIEFSAQLLHDWAWANYSVPINMNMPGTGCGRLSEAAVLPLLTRLPVNVSVWRFAHEAPRQRTVVNEPDTEDQSE